MPDDVEALEAPNPENPKDKVNTSERRQLKSKIVDLMGSPRPTSSNPNVWGTSYMRRATAVDLRIPSPLQESTADTHYVVEVRAAYTGGLEIRKRLVLDDSDIKNDASLTYDVDVVPEKGVDPASINRIEKETIKQVLARGRTSKTPQAYLRKGYDGIMGVLNGLTPEDEVPHKVL